MYYFCHLSSVQTSSYSPSYSTTTSSWRHVLWQQQRAYRAAEAEAAARRDDVIESRVGQLNVLRRRIDDVLGLRVDAVTEASTSFDTEPLNMIL